MDCDVGEIRCHSLVSDFDVVHWKDGEGRRISTRGGERV